MSLSSQTNALILVFSALVIGILSNMQAVAQKNSPQCQQLANQTAKLSKDVQNLKSLFGAGHPSPAAKNQLRSAQNELADSENKLARCNATAQAQKNRH